MLTVFFGNGAIMELVTNIGEVVKIWKDKQATMMIK